MGLAAQLPSALSIGTVIPYSATNNRTKSAMANRTFSTSMIRHPDFWIISAVDAFRDKPSALREEIVGAKCQTRRHSLGICITETDMRNS